MTVAIRVELGVRGYDVLVGRGVLDQAGHVAARAEGARQAVVVTQPPVAERYAGPVRDALTRAGLDATIVTVEDGEAAKSLATLEQLYAHLAGLAFGRRDVVVAVGGGVVGDLAGFLAATWHRGVPVIQVPTTLLAQVDAAIGGKTGVNLVDGKNLVGAFHQPLGVVADVDVLTTLPSRQVVAGLAEVVKCGLIRDPAILDVLETAATSRAGPAGESGPAGADLVRDLDLTAELVRRAAAVKAAVVGADEREAGERAHLNLGHTVGHALEAVTGYRRLQHGEAVAVGTCVALRLGRRMGLTPPELVARAERLLRALGLPTRAPPVDRARLWDALVRDKKSRGQVRFVLLEDLARCVVISPPPDAVDAVLDEVIESTGGPPPG